MKNKLLVLCMILIFSLVGCGKTTLDQTALPNTPINESDAWMEPESEEEFFDVDTMDGGDVDYSKYEEKNTESPVPEGTRSPVEPGEVEVDKNNKKTCYLTISCATVLDHMGELTAGKEQLIPSDGLIYATKKVTFYEGETVFDILLRETKKNQIHMEYSFNPAFNSNYLEAINNLYEFDCGKGSGWMYNVNGWYPNYGSSRYMVQEGDEIQWNYTCDLGRDLGAGWMDQNGAR